MKENNLLQDNKSTILLAEKGRSSLGKRTRAMNVRYFAVKDCVDQGELQIYHQPTEDMIGDFFTKPLQGSKFLRFRALILGLKKTPTSGTKELREVSSNMPKTEIPRRDSARKAPLRVSFS